MSNSAIGQKGVAESASRPGGGTRAGGSVPDASISVTAYSFA